MEMNNRTGRVTRFHKFSTVCHGNIMRAIRVVSLGSLMFVNAVQASPTLLNTNLQLRLVLNTPTTSQSVRIAKDPRNNQLYYLKINGDIYQVNLTNSTSTGIYSSADHGLSNSVEGLAIGPDGTIYVLANLTSGNYSYVEIMKGVPNSSGVRVWSLLAKTDLWQRSETQFDHDCSAVIVSLDGQYLYYNAGSRTDHGEVEDAGGIFPNTRDVPLTAKIFRVPLNSSLYTAGPNLYRRHRDKLWQLTDCISFAVMKQQHVREALTGDQHFEQAGFTALLK